ncbi:MAG: diguanylate cyclase, partial [Acidobacteria bacterium]|nr:diguanylate cyclase [Acidobacteriota bacterium]
YLDEPTGLANLRHFEESLEEEWRRGLRSGTALGLLVLSLPGLPALVERDGKDAGEAVEVAVAQTLLAALRRAGDLAARLGEGSFAVLVPGAAAEDTLAIREDLSARLSALSLPEGGVRIGSASTVPTREGSAAALVAEARAT